jgi:hypothetical protein
MIKIKFISHARPLLWNPFYYINVNRNTNVRFYSQKGFHLLGIPETSAICIFALETSSSTQTIDEIKEIIIRGVNDSFLKKRIFDITEDVTKEYIDTYYIMIENDDGPRIFKFNPIKWNLGVFDLIEVSIDDLKRETD